MTNLKRTAGGVSFVLTLILAAVVARAESLDRKFYVGLGTGYYFPTDQEGGGFRTSPSGENAVALNRGLIWQGILGYGFPLPPPKEGGRRRTGLAFELDVRYFDQTVGEETVFLDPDASTIQHIPIPLPIFANTPARTFDETTETRKLGRLKMMPVLANAVMRFGVQKKTTAYAGGGIGWVFTEFDRYDSYTDIVGYEDGGMANSIAFNVKGGIDVALTKRVIFNFTGDYLIIPEHFTWSGVDNAFGTQNFDLETSANQAGYGIPDVYGRPADYRLVDPGNIRMDGLTMTVGFRFVLWDAEKKPKSEAPQTSESKKKSKKEKKEKAEAPQTGETAK